MRVMGRATQGVKVIRIDKGDSIADIAVIPKSEEEETNEENAEGVENAEGTTSVEGATEESQETNTPENEAEAGTDDDTEA